MRSRPAPPLRPSCATWRARASGSGFVAHPYPVTPFHGDYLAHADRAETARRRILGGDAPALPGGLKVRASGLARGLARPEWLSDGTWDAAIEEVGAAGLVADATVALNGWLGPRWARSGWFHAYRLLEGSITDGARKQEVEAIVARLQTGAYAGNVERLNLERELVGLLASGCRTMVAGYTVKREHFNAEFSAGVENISFDALQGFSSPMFLRTVKLKDFPWNGWLQLGLAERPGQRLEPDRRLHRSVRPPHVVCHRRPGRHPLALRGGLDAQPHLRGGGLAQAMTGGAPSLSLAHECRPVGTSQHEGVSDRGAPIWGYSCRLLYLQPHQERHRTKSAGRVRGEQRRSAA